ncbi:MAG: FMN-binding protein [SAR324 cluster bacterium]|nr:FMN-binding protein [SAR324 cluster bacterium]
MIRALGGIATIAGVIIVFVFQFTQPYIAENKRRAIEKAIYQVVPGAVNRTSYLLNEQALMLETEFNESESSGSSTVSQVSTETIYAAFDASGKLVGIAMEAAAQGYQDVIRILYGYSPECECITGISILKSTETPGLGDKIGTDLKFLANFIALDAKLNQEKTALLNPIETVKHGRKTADWQIDSISGATVSSNAIGKMLRESTKKMLPLLIKHLHKIIKS